MPPKPAGKGATKGSDSQGILSHAESLTGKATLQNETTGKAVPKVESATRLWSHALTGEPQREEVFKAQVVPALVSLLERGAAEERWAACAALHALAQSEKHITEVVTTKVISCAAALLSSTHDRSRQPAAQLLAFLAQRMEYSARVSDHALLPLLGCCTPGAIAAWGGARVTALHAVTALRALVENVQGEAPGSKVARRNMLIAAGAVPTLVNLVTYAPRLPEPRVVPAVPPVGGKKGGGSAGKGRKGADVRPAAGRKDMIATHAAACLRFLALCPHFQEELLGCHSLGLLVQSLLSDSAEQAAYVCGILWELTADTGVAQEVCDHDGVKCLLHVVSLHLAGVKGKSKAKKKTDGQTSSKKADKTDPAAPPNYCEIAVCNALGALHHLTFLDAAKVQLCALNGAAILMPCLKLANVQAFENATGALWNTGLHPDNTNSLIAAGVPRYLCHPVPHDWMVVTEPDIQPAAAPEQLEAHAHTGPSFFLTQAT